MQYEAKTTLQFFFFFIESELFKYVIEPESNIRYISILKKSLNSKLITLYANI